MRIAGVVTNTAWLARAASHPAFRAGDVSTAFAAEHADALALGDDEALHACIAAGALLASLAPGGERAVAMGARRRLSREPPPRVELRLKRGKAPYDVALQASSPQLAAECGATRVRLEIASREGDLLHGRLLDSGEAVDAFVAGNRVTVWRGAETTTFSVVDEREASGGAHHVAGSLATPLPGVVIRVAVKPGDRVKAGDLLVIVEAMKMEHAIRAPHDGVVRAVKYHSGERVPEGAALIELDPV